MSSPAQKTPTIWADLPLDVLRQVAEVARARYPQPVLNARDVLNVADQSGKAEYLANLGRFSVREEIESNLETVEINMQARAKHP